MGSSDPLLMGLFGSGRSVCVHISAALGMRLLNTMMKTVFVDEAAALLGVSRRTVYYRIQDGKLKTMRTACGSQRVLVESIAALLAEQTAVATARAFGASGRDPFGKSPETALRYPTGRDCPGAPL